MNPGLPYLDAKTRLEDHFSVFRKNIIGIDQSFRSPFGIKRIVYADWTATGRAYRPIEESILRDILPWLGNTHSRTTVTGTLMSEAYAEAKSIVKDHVHASPGDALVFCGSGMTAAVNKLQRILGLRVPERIAEYLTISLQPDEDLRPIVFVTHMEHHSNQLSWLETIADVEIIGRNEQGNVDLRHFKSLLEQFRNRKNKIAALTACSNVTGIETPYHEMATLIHQYGGLCFVDFACSAPYCPIDMHPRDPLAALDAIYFSFHKFLGGPGTPGVLIFNQDLCRNGIPDQPGGGTVIYSNPWGDREYVKDIEEREDGGTPPFLQAIRAAMCVRLKEKMGVANMLEREEEILKVIFPRMLNIKNLEVLERNITKRMGVISFLVKGAHYNLIVKLLNDRFGIQTRGGCSCAGTYGHTLFGIDRDHSATLLESIRDGDLSCKPGWVRLSIHPTMTNAETGHIMDAIEETVENFQDWGKDYAYVPHLNEYIFKSGQPKEENKIADRFDPSRWSNYLAPSERSGMHKR